MQKQNLNQNNLKKVYEPMIENYFETVFDQFLESIIEELNFQGHNINTTEEDDQVHEYFWTHIKTIVDNRVEQHRN